MRFKLILLFVAIHVGDIMASWQVPAGAVADMAKVFDTESAQAM